MKGKKFYIAIIGLFVIGIGSIVMYRQQQEARALEFEGYEIATIESRVDALYNDDKTDIQEDIESELAELEQIFLELNKKDLSNRSERRIENIEYEFISANKMFKLQENISDLFREEDIVRENASTDNIEELQSSLVSFEDRTTYYSRNHDLLTNARVQIETIEEAIELVENLMTDEKLNEDINEETLVELEEMVDQIKDEDIKERLLEQITSVRLVLNEIEMEEELVLDEPEDLEEELEEEEIEEVIEEETIEEESVETVQKTNQRTEQSDTSATQNNNQSNNSNSSSSSSSSSNNQSGSQNDNQSGSQKNDQSGSQKNDQSDSQNDNQSSTSEQRPAVAEQYQETKVIEEIPYETFIYENSNIAAGEEIVYSEGSQGSVTETYEVIIYTSGTSNRKIISKDRTEPVDRIVTIGTKGN